MAKPAQSKYYNLFWRWHFYAGLIITPIVLILAVTGGLYLFQPQIEGWKYHDRIFLKEVYEGAVNHDAIIAAAKKQFGAKQVHSYQPPAAPDQSVQVVLTAGNGEKLTAFLHPGTHQVLGTVDEKWRLMNVAREIHRGLLLGTPGRVITELTACWLIVMILTGIYLWWPRGDKSRGSAFPRIKAKGRLLWREFHAVSGAWISLWVLALLLTGLPWAMVWGGILSDAARKAGEAFPAAVFDARPISTSDAALPEISMNRLMVIAVKNNITHGFKIDYPWWEKGSYALIPTRQPHDSEHMQYLFFDRRTGKILERYGWEDLGKVGRLTSLGVAFHEGRLFGSLNQILNFIAVLGVISLCITGPIMWWKRKPKNALGAPRVGAKLALSKPLIGLIVLIGILLPLFGLSLVLILLCDMLLTKWKARCVE